jgi:hypothetical protein
MLINQGQAMTTKTITKTITLTLTVTLNATNEYLLKGLEKAVIDNLERADERNAGWAAGNDATIKVIVKE